MAGRRLWAVIAVLIGASALPAAGSQPWTAHDPDARIEVRRAPAERPLAELLDSGDARAVVARSAKLLRDASLSEAPDEAAGEEGPESYDPTGDLDGDGTNDLLGQRWATRIAALSGADGSELWTRAIDHPLSGAAGARLGPDARDGVVVLDYEMTPVPGGESILYTFTALDGAGRQLWSTPVQGTSVRMPTNDELATVGLPIGLNVADVDGDGATDFRLALLDHVLPAVRGSSVSTVVISGADGSLGARSPDVAVTGSPATARLPDLDGDGRGELAVLDLAKAATTLTAVDGRTGAALWSAGGLDLYSFYVYDEYLIWVLDDIFSSLGDATGDGRADLRILQYDRATKSIVTAVADGATGAVGFNTDLAVRRLGDVIGNSAAEILVVGLERSGTTVTTTYDAVSFAGVSRRQTVRRMDVGDRPRRYAWTESVGDVDGDGVSDIEHDLAYGTTGDTVRDSVLLSGAAMAELWHPEAGYFTRSFDGSGADHVTVTPGADQVTVTTRDGRTGVTLWTRTMVAAGPSSTTHVDVDADGAHELLIDHACPTPCGGGSGVDVTLLGSDGAVVWSRRR